MTRHRILITAVIVVAVAAAAFLYFNRNNDPKPVFVIVVDTLRADRLSCYGYDGHETPALDGLAARGILFERAYAVGGWTVPSMGALMTSLYPTQLGLIEEPKPRQRFFKVRERREQLSYTVAPGYTTLAELFRDAGFATAAFVNQPVLNNHDGFIQGYEEWYHPVSADTILRRDPHGDPSEYRHGILADDVYRADSALVEYFTDWLGENASDDLFVWVHLLTPHWPYRPPARYGVGPEAPPSKRYDAEVRYTDDMVGEILEAIDARCGLDRSVVVFTSDHGEEFGEHGSRDHGHSLHSECAHVPLMIVAPGVDPARVEATVPLTDVLPTLTALAGMDAPGAIEGTDLEPLFDGGEDRRVYSEGMLYGSTERSLVAGGLRVMFDAEGDSWRLFDIESDFGELDDIAGERPDETDAMKERLVELHSRLADDFVRIARSRTAADSAADERERERALEAMRSLGYIND